MQTRPSENLKQVAAELAALVYSHSDDEQRMAALLEQLPRPAASATGTAAAAAHMPSTGIGIWNPVANSDGTYERDAARRQEWPLWANVHKIHPKGNRKRVLLLGESVARGYFYDPYYTVATELEATLGAALKPDAIEVTDLARTSMHMQELLDLAAASAALKPDAVVVFAGNNWVSILGYYIGEEEYAALLDEYRRTQFPGVRKRLEEVLAKVTEEFLQKLAVAYPAGVPILFIIPPFNLRDWHSDETEQILPWMPDNRLEQWLQAKAIAERSWREGDIDACLHAAEQMTAIDASNPLGFEWLGRAYSEKEEWSDAAHAFGQARDTVIINRGSNSKPRCFGIIAQTIAARAPALGIEVLNLPEVFLATAGRVPGRELFLDYCHLTAEGIRIAMHHAARKLVRLLGYNASVTAHAHNLSAALPADVQALAHFCAAIHNAHYGQGDELLNYHCRRAVELSPSVDDVMLQYMNFAACAASTVLCSSYRQILTDGSMRQYEGGLALAHPPGQKLMDVGLNTAIARALSVRQPQAPVELAELLLAEHSVAGGELDLLQSFYSKTDYNSFAGSNRLNFYQARSVVSRFQFVAGSRRALRFSISYRTPGDSYKNKFINIFVNDIAVPAELPASACWNTCAFTVDQHQLETGVNNLRIEWPYVHEPLPETGRITADNFIGLLFPVLGEIHAFTVSPAADALATPLRETAVASPSSPDLL